MFGRSQIDVFDTNQPALLKALKRFALVLGLFNVETTADKPGECRFNINARGDTGGHNKHQSSTRRNWD